MLLYMLKGVILNLKENQSVNIGNRYGSLVVVSDTEKTDKKGYKKFLCHCDCGNDVVKTSRYLTRTDLKTHSCGCQNGKANQTHGLSKTDGRLYDLWQAMRWRTNPRNTDRYTYRQKNIQCCQAWNDYIKFREWSLANGYNDTLTLDRIDNMGDYSQKTVDG